MIRKSVLMMTNTGRQWNVVGNAISANSYYGYTDSLITVQVIYQNFIGSFGIQGTLSTSPTDEDWFWINSDLTENTSSPLITFPVNPLEPTGDFGGDSGSVALNFTGNFTYLRAMLVRDFASEPPVDNFLHGQIDKVLVSF